MAKRMSPHNTKRLFAVVISSDVTACLYSRAHTMATISAKRGMRTPSTASRERRPILSLSTTTAMTGVAADEYAFSFSKSDADDDDDG